MAGMMGPWWFGNWTGGFMGGMWFPVMWMLAIFWLISIIFIVWALIKIAGSNRDVGYKLIWAAIVVFLGLVGVLAYYLVERPEKEMGRQNANKSNASRHGSSKR